MPELSLFLIILALISVLLVILIILLAVPKRRVWKIVLNMMKEGKTIEEILSYTKSKHLNEKEVKMYYLLYIAQDYMENGYNQDEIENMAIDNGWPKEMVDIVLNKLG